MADTDEPLNFQQNKSFIESNSSSSFTEMKSSYLESKSYSNSQQKNDMSSSYSSQSYSSTPQVQRSSYIEKTSEMVPSIRLGPSSKVRLYCSPCVFYSACIL